MSGSRSVDIFISLPNEIKLLPTLPIDSIIKKSSGSISRSNHSGFIIGQSEQIKHQWKNNKHYSIMSSSDDIYPINLRGIGLKIIYHDGNMQHYDVPCSSQSTHKVFCGEEFYRIEVQLIKTAEQVEAGHIPQHQLTEATIGNVLIVNFKLRDVKIIVPEVSCFINNKALEINLGRLKTTFFKGMYSTASKKTFYLELNCT